MRQLAQKIPTATHGLAKSLGIWSLELLWSLELGAWNFWRVLILAFFICAIVAPLSAQPPQGTVSGGWTQRIPYDPPNSSHIKWEISGSEASTIPDSGGKILLKGVRMKQFSLAGGEPEMVADAPQCIADRKLDAVSSDGPLQVHAQGDKFFVEGTGFLLKQGESTLWISNQVHSIVKQTGTNAPPGPGTEIFSHRARFEMKNESPSAFADYEGNVWINDPKMKLTCESLVAEMPKPKSGDTNRNNHLVAQTNVVIDFVNTNGEHILAAGEKAVYDRATENTNVHELLNLSGAPRIELTNGWMTADTFTMDRATDKLRGHGAFHFHFLGANQSPDAKTQATAATPADTDIFSDEFEYDINTRQSAFWVHVRVRNAELNLLSEALTVDMPRREPGQPNRPEHMIADTNVRIDFIDQKSGATNHATGQKAVYDYKVAGAITNEILELTGNPSVEFGKPAGWMTADLIRADRAQGTFTGIGNQHSVFKRQADEPATMDTEVFSEQLDFANDTGLAIYRDNVRAYDPELNMTGGVLTIKRAKTPTGSTNQINQTNQVATNHIERINADDNVVLSFLENAFSAGDITNLTNFAARLKQPPDNDAVAQFVSTQLSASTQSLLAKYNGGTNAPLCQAFAKDLNLIVQRGSVYEQKRFTGIFLSPDTTDLMATHPLGVDLIELNRLLLLDAFRGQLARTQNGEITHATADHAIYTYKSIGKKDSGVLELDGNPKLQQPHGWLTAGKSIISDRTTGVTHYVGAFHLLADLPPSSKGKLPGESKNGSRKDHP